ncbi:MAG TPA: choice-of-anchor N protein [Xanthobacteraceae bacterium]|nr:choice-of-anchor N protein [Xanthobacteraceae bacterium]
MSLFYNRMKLPLKLLSLVLGFSAVNALAIPALQLDISGGVYDTVDETTFATSPVFTLRALLRDNQPFNNPYYISAAISPQLAELPIPDIGSFTFAGTTYTGAALHWGTPPSNVPDNQPGDLAPHSVFPTYYFEYAFDFTGAPVMAAYNTATGATANGQVYYRDFTVDITQLLPGYSVHFDLYDERVRRGTYTVDDFAPFSHDASSGTNTRVPDSGSSLILVGLAAALMLGARRMRLA